MTLTVGHCIRVHKIRSDWSILLVGITLIAQEIAMGRGILLWLLGVPLPVILLLAMCSHR